MHEQLDLSVCDVRSTRISLRDDLIFTPESSHGRPYYMVEDPLNSRFFRLGTEEYTFVSLLDGHTTLEAAFRQLSQILPHHRLGEHDIAGLCRWLVEMELAHAGATPQADRIACRADAAEQQRLTGRGNPLLFRLPLCCPDAFFTTLTRWFGWLHSPAAMGCWFFLLAIAAYRVLSEQERFGLATRGIFSQDNWPYLILCWGVLKVVHELSHGVACKRYGGAVREMGIVFFLLAPLAYIDVSSSWRFRSRLQRVHVAAAGMYLELAVASVAAILWSHTDSGWLNHLYCHTAVMASLPTLLVNANPLMRFDGYFILADVLSLPNLDTSGQLCLRYGARRYLLGLPAALPDWPSSQRAIFCVYGCLSFGWRMFMVTCVATAAVTMWQGAGVILSAGVLVLWLGVPVWRLATCLVRGEGAARPCRLRFVLTSTAAAAAAAAVLTIFYLVPWPGGREAPAVVEYAPHTPVRAGSAGFVREIRVASGDRVTAGQILVVMENEDLVLELADLELQIRQSEIRSRWHEQKNEVAAQQAETKQGEALRTQREEKRAQVDKLMVRAPHNGTVIRLHLDTLLGTYLHEGDDLLSLGDESHKELQVSLAQDDLAVFAQHVGEPVRIDFRHLPPWHARLEKLIPRASLSPPHPALIAVHGGPLPVRPAKQTFAEGESCSFELLAPRFTAKVGIGESRSAELFAGQIGSVTCRPRNESIGRHLWFLAARWMASRLVSPPGDDE